MLLQMHKWANSTFAHSSSLHLKSVNPPLSDPVIEESNSFKLL